MSRSFSERKIRNDHLSQRSLHCSVQEPTEPIGNEEPTYAIVSSPMQDVLETYSKVTERPLGYMLLDLHPASQDDARILSHALKEEGIMRCYQFRPSC